ncbi:MAG: GHKL domain-containing protein, partial [Methanosarcinaceae archaeon]|nr:GHKL domain-containing protein [Methanosarcinaceae archaeon]
LYTEEATITPVQSQDGEITHFIAVKQDVTEQKQLQERLQLHHANMAHLLRLGELGEMTSSLAHEINQPLCAIENYAQACMRLLETKNNTNHVSDILTDIRSQAERAGKIVNRVKGLVQRKSPHYERIEIMHIIRETINLISAELNNTKVQVICEIPDNLPPACADMILIQQVLLNLIRNSIEAMKGPGVLRKQLTLHAETSPNKMITISISDTGCGIPEENIDKIFYSFYTTKTNGLGIGLSLSKAIIESHGGQLWASANPGGGASFHFTLPERNLCNET